MGGVTNAVGGLVGGVAGGLTGGIQKASAAAGPQPYKGTTLPVDENAYKINKLNNLTYEQSGQTSAAKNAAQRQTDIANTSNTQQNVTRDQQSALISALQRQAAGQGPSLATATLKAAQDRSLKQQLAAAAAQRGGNQAAVQRALAYSQAQQAGELGQQAAQGRIQEQLNAQQALASALQGQRGQDIGVQQNSFQNQLAAQGLQQQSLANEFNQQSAAQKAAADYQNTLIQQNLAAQGLTASGVAAQNAASAQLTGGLLGGLGAAFSDKKMKTNIKSASSYSDEETKKKKEDEMTDLRSGQEEHDVKLKKDSSVKTKAAIKGAGSALGEHISNSAAGYNQAASDATDTYKKAMSAISDKKDKTAIKSESADNFSPKKFLDALKAYSFEYKDDSKALPGAGDKRYLGVMAQDLEKAGPVGKSMVQDTTEGKKVDFGKGFGAMLASQADLNSRLSDIEEGYGKVLKAKKAKSKA